MNQNGFLDTLKILQTSYPKDYLNRFVTSLKGKGLFDRQIESFVHQYLELNKISQEEYNDILKLLNLKN